MGKAPAFQFYVRDWLSDPQLRQARPVSRGVWIDCLCFMWEAPERGKLDGTTGSFLRMLGINVDEYAAFIEDAERTGFCKVERDKNVTVTESHVHVTLINRRMYREAKEKEKDREQARIRKQRQREREGNEEPCHANVTPPSSSSSSSSSSKNKKLCPEQAPGQDEIFLSIPLKDGTEYQVTNEKVKAFLKTYPALGLPGVEQALRRCLQWNLDNPSKRKTLRGINKHISVFMDTAMERLPKDQPQDSQPPGSGFWGNDLDK